MEDKFHFEIPPENVRNEHYQKQGMGTTVCREDHYNHGLRLISQTSELKLSASRKKDFNFTSNLYLQIETPEGFPIKDQKNNLEKIGFDLISYSKENLSIGTARIKKESLPVFEEKLNEYTNTPTHTRKTYFSAIQNISLVSSESKIKDKIDVNSDDEVSIVINLYNVLEAEERLVIVNSIMDELKDVAYNIESFKFSNGITSIACQIVSKDITSVISEYTTVKEIKENFVAFVESSMPVSNMPNPLSIAPPESESVVCVVDSGIKDDNGIFDGLVAGSDNFLPHGAVDCSYEHGSFVASRLLFGDNIDRCLSTHILKPYCRVFDVAVFGYDMNKNKIGPPEFLLRKTLDTIVQEYHEVISVYNLSLNTPKAIADGEFSELAKLLDFLSKKYKVLFIISAGNINERLGDFPIGHFSSENSRIGSPAESILAITVGSIAKHENDLSLSSINVISPFSKIGPGADFGVKPELVAHGGNLITPYTPLPRVSTYGISVDGKSLCVDNGTSFSAPIIAQYAQKLFDLYPNSDPNLVKALLCHFTDVRYTHNEVLENEINYVGFGEPNIESAIQAGEFNGAFIYEGLLDQENYQYVKFHVPSILAEDNPNSKLKLKVTITYDPPINADNESEYSKTRISAKLIKPTKEGNREIGLSGNGAYNLPWNPIIKYEKSFSRSYLTGEWELCLRLYTRGDLSDDYLQDYAVVIEIIDEKKGVNVYDELMREYGGIYEKIKIIAA